ncbi:MAG: Dph6-related ATP pyrophosphatase [Nitrososphaerales archaeon]
MLSWSGGKDSALCLFEASRSRELQISCLLTTVTQDYDRISMHGVRRDLLVKQSLSIGLPLIEVGIPKYSTNEIYESKMSEKLLSLEQEGVSVVLFGDLFLQDIRNYRENLVGKLGLRCAFPLWGRDTTKLARGFIDSGFRAIICCVDPKKLGKEFCGRQFDSSFLVEIPDNVDPSGENGEFHTFVYDGPIFAQKIEVKVGEVVERDGFYFADILSV